MPDAQAIILFSTFSYTFLLANRACDALGRVLIRVDVSNKENMSAKDTIAEEKFTPSNEWLSTSAATYVAGDDKQLLANLRRNMQSRTPEEIKCLWVKMQTY